MIPRGVCFDIPAARRLQAFSTDAQRAVKARLAEFGIEGLDPGNPRQTPPRAALERYFLARKLLDKFPLTEKGNYSFSREALEKFEHADPAVEFLLTLKRLIQVVDDPFYGGLLCNETGRVLYDLNPLGADTGRPTSSRPNLIGLGKKFRPLVIGDPRLETGLVELDMEQQEPLICAYLAGDEAMIRAYEAGDLYSEMAKVLFRAELSQEDLALPNKRFKQQHRRLRETCKAITLGILYGMGEDTIAARTHRGAHSVRRILQEFDASYPHIAMWRQWQPVLLEQRGFATTISGLRRHRNRSGALNGWERRWAVNMPVQGSASDILKLTILLVQLQLARIGARIVLPIYDALLVEAPLARLQEAAQIAHDGFIAAFYHFFPGACPRIDINDKHPQYWNKESSLDAETGKNSLERFLRDPLMSFDK